MKISQEKLKLVFEAESIEDAMMLIKIKQTFDKPITVAFNLKQDTQLGVHKRQRRIRCLTCGKTFTRQKSLAQHLAWHPRWARRKTLSNAQIELENELRDTPITHLPTQLN